MTDIRLILRATGAMAPVAALTACGCQWRALPSGYPPFSTVQNYFYAWRRSGLLERLVHRLRDLARRCSGRGSSELKRNADSAVPAQETAEAAQAAAEAETARAALTGRSSSSK